MHKNELSPNLSTYGWNTYAQSTTAINNGTWHHVVISRDGESKVAKVYIDGVLESEKKTGDINLNHSLSTLRAKENQNAEGVIGSYSVRPMTLDNLRIFNRVLSDEEVSKLYQLDIL